MAEQLNFNGRKLVIEGAHIGMRNFIGEKSKYNAKGNRNFVVFLEEDEAEYLAKFGWNVKFPKQRDDIDPAEDKRKPFLKVTVSEYSSVYQVVERPDGEGYSTVELDELGIGSLQRADLLKCDLTINPYRYTDDDGYDRMSAFLETGYFVLDVDAFGMKYGRY